MENADLDRILGLSGYRRRKAKDETRRGGKPATVPRSSV